MAIRVREDRLSPLLKYPGGKDRELRYILPNLPQDAENYYEPFVGGGAVYFALDGEHYYINDRSAELMRLYEMVAEQNEDFLGWVDGFNHNWIEMSRIVERHRQEFLGIYEEYRNHAIERRDLPTRIAAFVALWQDEFNGLLNGNFNIEVGNFLHELEASFQNKIGRMRNLEDERGALPEEDVISNLEGALKSAFYTHFRFLYNHVEQLHISRPFATAIYYFMREYCYSSMFRYNRDGQFNVPYGGISYNRKTMTRKAEYFRSPELVNQLGRTTMGSLDFHEFVTRFVPGPADFMFLDPPYDTEFSTYALNVFNQADQVRLADYLIGECRARFMLIIKNTDFIRNLYQDGTSTVGGDGLHVNSFAKRYFVSFRDRNDKNAQHLLITNYQIPGIVEG